jgi:hypothetical protein
VTVTNVTAGQTFPPFLFATHRPGFALFEEGEPAGDGLEFLAESGDVSRLRAALEADPAVGETVATTGFLPPGESLTVTITARGGFTRLSFAAMLIPTNDSFVALEGVALPRRGALEVDLPAYDAGTEPNSELCADIPGPFCQGEGADLAEDGEGFVHISRGIGGVGEGAGDGSRVTEARHDWRNPVAEVTVRRLGGG